MQPGGDDDVRKIAIANLDTWKQSGVVKALRCFSVEDEGVCSACKARHGAVVTITDGSIGANLPPLDACVNYRCRCYFRPWYVSIQ
jgi:SPP1 gp7 family putative phage head morphogenesis protein